jgi:hypothetical protein
MLASSHFRISYLPVFCKKIKICIIIISLVLYLCETWSLTTREEHRLRVLENRVLRRVFEPKREEGKDYMMSFIVSTYIHILE